MRRIVFAIIILCAALLMGMVVADLAAPYIHQPQEPDFTIEP